jgi:Tfp pilus assembly protein PilE
VLLAVALLASIAIQVNIRMVRRSNLAEAAAGQMAQGA